MGGHDHGGAGLVDAVQQAHDPDGRVGIEVPGGLVGQQDQGPVDEGPGDRHPLLLATRELVGQVVALLGQPHQVQDLGHLGGDHVLGTADDVQGEGHVLVDGLVGEEAEVLEDAADVAAQVWDLPVAELADLLARHPDVAAVGLLFLEQQPEKGRLPRTGRSHQEDELTLLDVDGRVAQSDGRALVGLGDVVQSDHQLGGGWGSGSAARLWDQPTSRPRAQACRARRQRR